MKDKLFMVLFVLALGTVLTTALVAVNLYTKPYIERNAVIKEKSSVLAAFGLAHDRDNLDEIFSRQIATKEAKGRTYYVSSQGDIAFPFAGPGLWGPITGVLSLNKDLSTITGLAIKHQEETPGLGSRIAEKPFLGAFINKEFVPELKLVAEGKSRAANEIDAITGATLSSEAFVNILNAQYRSFISAFQGKE